MPHHQHRRFGPQVLPCSYRYREYQRPFFSIASKEWVIQPKPKPGRKPKKDIVSLVNAEDQVSTLEILQLNLVVLTFLEQKLDSGGRRVQNRLSTSAYSRWHTIAHATSFIVLHSVHSEKESKHSLLNFKLESNHMNKGKLSATCNFRVLRSGSRRKMKRFVLKTRFSKKRFSKSNRSTRRP